MDEYTQRFDKIEEALASALPESFDGAWVQQSFGPTPPAIKSRHFKSLTDGCRELLLRGGKRWRPLLMALSCELAGGSDRAYSLAPLIELAHTASLIHDDLEDCADERRGGPAIHILYGNDAAVNAGSWLYFQAASCIDSFPGDDALKARLYLSYMKNIRRLHLGQAMDISWHRDTNFIPSRAEYEAMVSLKTGALFRLAVEVGMMCAGKTEKETSGAADLAVDIGVGFQVLDDAQNILSGSAGKKRGDDIVEGKKSLPLILFANNHPEEIERITAYFAAARSGGIEAPEVTECIEALVSSGAAEQARQYGNMLIERSCLALRGRYADNRAADLIADFVETMKR